MNQYQEIQVDGLVTSYVLGNATIPNNAGNRDYNYMITAVAGTPWPPEEEVYVDSEILPWVPPTTEEEEAAEQEDAIVDATGNNEVFAALSVLTGKLDATQVTPAEAESLFQFYPTWAQPLAYVADQLINYDGKNYRCISGHTSQAGWEPPNVPALWTVYVDPDGPPQPWVQPAGAHDAYRQGAKVTHNGDTWESTVASNVWEPGVYGWVVV